MELNNFFKKKKSYFKSLALKMALVIVLVFLDIITKHFAEKHFLLGNPDIVLIPNVLSLTYAQNTGAAFSLFSENIVMLSIISFMFVIMFMVYDYFYHEKSAWYFISFAFILSGAVGNLIDRLTLGYVIDFVRFDFITFPIFNLADMFLTFGIISYAVYVLFFYNKSKTKTDKNN